MQHADVQPGSVHTPFNWLFASDTDRLAASGFAPGDVSKVAVDLDTGEQWRVSAVDGAGVPSWQRLGYPASNVITSPAGAAEQDLLVRSGSTWARLAVGTAGKQLVVKSDGTVGWVKRLGISVEAWGASPTASSTQNRISINAAIDWQNGRGGGPVDFPGGSTYTIDQPLFDYAGIIWNGGGANGTTIRADTGGDFTVAPANIAVGDRPGRFIVKWNGGDVWAHGVSMTNIRFDTANVAGLGAVWHQAPGERSWFDRLRCDSCAPVRRTVADAQITNGSNVVTFTASTVTEDDINGLITDAAGGTHPNFPAGTKIDRINWANPTAFPPQRTATSVTLNNPASSGATNASLSINTPTDAFVFQGGAATGRIGTLQGSNNSGALLRWLGPTATATSQSTAGSVSVDSLSGDGNGGGNLRIDRMAMGADPMSFTVGQIKSENPGGVYQMDPVVLITRCGMLNFRLRYGTGLTSGGRDLVRQDQKQGQGGPAITIEGGEGANPFNTAYTNIYHDTDTGEVVLSGSNTGTPVTNSGVVTGQRYFPDIIVGRDIILAGGAKIPKHQTKRRYCPMWATPDATYNSSTWTRQYQAGSLGTFQIVNGTNAQNDGAAWQVDVSAGVWKMTLAYQKNVGNAIVTIDFSQDGGNTWTSIGTLDEYASLANANFADFTGIVVPYDGTALVRFRALTRNASNTTGWTIAFSGMEWSRTA